MRFFVRMTRDWTKVDVGTDVDVECRECRVSCTLPHEIWPV